MSAEAIKALLKQPLVLFAVMQFAQFLSAAQQVLDARSNGGTMTCRQYLSHWPETMIAMGFNLLAFLFLIVTDTLNYMSALGLGFVANLSADLVTKGGRSAALRAFSQPTGDPK